jgi:hypothetical protein
MRKRKALLSTTILSGAVGGWLTAAASVASAADLSVPVYKAPPAYAAAPLAWEPAVDAINEKMEALGGSIGGKTVYGATGSLTVPLLSQYGVQLDGGAGSLDGDSFGQVAGHLFWRNPSQALLGVYASYTGWDRFGGVNVGQVAGEFEFYYGRFTLQGIAGVEFGNTVSSSQTNLVTIAPVGGIPGSTTLATNAQGFGIGTRFFDQVNLKYYLNDYLDGYVGHRYLGGKNAAAFGGEYAFPVARGVLGSAFVEARVGESDFHGVWGGIKLYFGPDDKSLIARHRKEDPNNWGVDTLFSILNNKTSSGSSSTAQFCNNGRTLRNGTCEGGS